MVRCMHATVPYRANDLLLNIGDIVVVTDDDPAKAWWQGYKQSEPETVGYFPVGFIEDIDDQARNVTLYPHMQMAVSIRPPDHAAGWVRTRAGDGALRASGARSPAHQSHRAASYSARAR